MLFSIIAAQIYIPTNIAQEFPFYFCPSFIFLVVLGFDLKALIGR
jgi:hypothetical protein